jgi:ion channel-forming bestrophin family protein
MKSPLTLKETISPLASSRTLRRVAVYASLTGVYALLAVGKEHTSYATVADFPAQIHAALTLVLGWLLVFRTNAAYNRWWEARTLWGALVNSSRNLSIKLFHMVEIPEDSRLKLEKLITAFPRALRDHLRRQPHGPEIGELIAGDEHHRHVPVAIATRIYAELARLREQSAIDGDDLRVIDVDAKVLLDVCGACERILNTRIVRSYRTFARQCIALDLLTFPWGIVEAFRWWTVPLTMITAYFLLGLETVAEHIEEPFGYDEDDLNLDALCEGIDESVRQIARSRDRAARPAG